MNRLLFARSIAGLLPFSLLAIAFLNVMASQAYTQDPPTGLSHALLKDFVDNCVLIEPGTEKFPRQFQMGGQFKSPFASQERSVTMTQSFRVSKFEMTQDLYTAIMTRNPSRWTGLRNSVESMTFHDAEVFCTRLTMQLRTNKLIASDEVVRLPTEAEWEYCCRAGTSSHYSFGNSAGSETDPKGATSMLNEYAWHTGNAAGNDPAVGVLKPNPWGLFDMHGYLWEFVTDEYATETTASINSSDTTQPTAGAKVHIIRGGSWRDHATNLTSGARQPIPDHVSSDAIGIRCIIAKSPSP